MPERLRERISARLDALGINPFEAARRAGLERSYVNDLLIGKKSTMRPTQLRQVAAALECDPDYLQGLQPVPRIGDLPEGMGVPLTGIIEPNAWREPGTGVPKTPLPLVPDPRYPADRQKWFLVRGDDLISLGIADGSIVIAVEGLPVRDGEPVVIRRAHPAGAFETSIRVKVDGTFVAPHGSTLTPAVIPEEDAELVGLVVMSLRTFGG